MRSAPATWAGAFPIPNGRMVRSTRRKRRSGIVVANTGAKTLHYTYDFGDDWEHVVRIERFTDPDPAASYPVLISASGRCPPEDVGGFPGYEEFLAAIADPDHEHHEEISEWWPDDFDPTTRAGRRPQIRRRSPRQAMEPKIARQEIRVAARAVTGRLQTSSGNDVQAMHKMAR